MEKAIEFLNQILNDKDKLVVACSGGPDSMCLLALACEIRELKNIDIICAYVNHNLRPESRREALFLQKYCEANKIKFATTELDFSCDKFSEQKGHKQRYAFFQAIAKANGAHFIATAHHGDDLIETILMRITRGSTLDGYLGFKKISKNKDFTIIRPLLDYTKGDIIDYNKKHHIPYCLDKSNKSLKYTRNRYRQKVLPFLKKEEANVHLKYQQFSNELQMYDDFIKDYIHKLKVINNKEIDVKKIANESVFIKRQVIAELINEIQTEDWLEVSEKNMQDLLKLLTKSNGEVSLNNGYIGQKDYTKLTITKKQDVQKFRYPLEKDLKTDNWELLFKNDSHDNSNNTIRLNSSEIILPLYVRNRQNGDRIAIKNLKGHKKVKDIFIDEKVSLAKRGNIPLVFDSNNELIWIPGLKKSKFAKNINEKYDIIIEYKVR